MNKQALLVVYVVAMVAIVAGVDFLFLRGLFWQRLLVNITVVLAFLLFYLAFLRGL
jgi:hypothetical protein